MASSGSSRFFIAPKFTAILLLSIELACGSISHRSEILQLLRRLPSVPVVENEEVMTFVERDRLMGRGVGWVDVAAKRRPGCLACTRRGVQHSFVNEGEGEARNKYLEAIRAADNGDIEPLLNFARS